MIKCRLNNPHDALPLTTDAITCGNTNLRVILGNPYPDNNTCQI